MSASCSYTSPGWPIFNFGWMPIIAKSNTPLECISLCTAWLPIVLHCNNPLIGAFLRCMQSTTASDSASLSLSISSSLKDWIRFLSLELCICALNRCIVDMYIYSLSASNSISLADNVLCTHFALLCTTRRTNALAGSVHLALHLAKEVLFHLWYHSKGIECLQNTSTMHYG
jgi:hypothetical protein